MTEGATEVEDLVVSVTGVLSGTASESGAMSEGGDGPTSAGASDATEVGPAATSKAGAGGSASIETSTSSRAVRVEVRTWGHRLSGIELTVACSTIGSSAEVTALTEACCV